MCGRFWLDVDDAQILEIIRIAEERVREKYPDLYDQRVATGEVFPTDIAPVLVAEKGGLSPVAMRWGFLAVPRQEAGRRLMVAYDGSEAEKPKPVINARQETAQFAPLFRESLAKRRVAIPTSGFYEWSHPDGKKAKDKFLFTEPGHRRLYLAGLWHLFPYRGTMFPHFTILTTGPNASMTPYHNRMPVLLEEAGRAAWLAGTGAREVLRRMPFALDAALAPIRE